MPHNDMHTHAHLVGWHTLTHIDDPGPELPLTDLTALAALLSPCYPVSTTMVPVVWTTASARALHQMPVTVLHN